MPSCSSCCPLPISEMGKLRPRHSNSLEAYNSAFSRPTLICWSPSAWSSHFHAGLVGMGVERHSHPPKEGLASYLSLWFKFLQVPIV